MKVNRLQKTQFSRLGYNKALLFVRKTLVLSV